MNISTKHVNLINVNIMNAVINLINYIKKENYKNVILWINLLMNVLSGG